MAFAAVESLVHSTRSDIAASKNLLGAPRRPDGRTAGGVEQPLAVLPQPPVLVQPGKAALDDPAIGHDLKVCDSLRSALPEPPARLGRAAISFNTLGPNLPSIPSYAFFWRDALLLQYEPNCASAIEAPSEPERSVIVVDETLPPGKATNAAAVVTPTLGERHSHLVGESLREREGSARPGLIPIGTPVLNATDDQLNALRQKSLAHCDVVDFPGQGQATVDCNALLRAVRALLGESLQYLAVGLIGPRRKVGELVGGFVLFAR